MKNFYLGLGIVTARFDFETERHQEETNHTTGMVEPCIINFIPTPVKIKEAFHNNGTALVPCLNLVDVSFTIHFKDGFTVHTFNAATFAKIMECNGDLPTAMQPGEHSEQQTKWNQVLHWLQPGSIEKIKDHIIFIILSSPTINHYEALNSHSYVLNNPGETTPSTNGQTLEKKSCIVIE